MSFDPKEKRYYCHTLLDHLPVEIQEDNLAENFNSFFGSTIICFNQKQEIGRILSPHLKDKFNCVDLKEEFEENQTMEGIVKEMFQKNDILNHDFKIGTKNLNFFIGLIYHTCFDS